MTDDIATFIRTKLKEGEGVNTFVIPRPVLEAFADRLELYFESLSTLKLAVENMRMAQRCLVAGLVKEKQG